MTRISNTDLPQGREIVLRLIYINIGVSFFVWLCSRLFGLLPMFFALESKLYFFPKLSILLGQPWRVVTYMWMHDGLMHLGVNMFVLWYVGQIFSERFGSRIMVSLYLLSGMGGALFYLILYQLQSFVGLNPVPYGLVGSSAAIFGLLFGYAFYDMESKIRISLLDRDVRVWKVVSILTLLHTLFLNQNLGGIGAHIGGIGIGLFFAWMLRSRGIDITRWLSAIIDKIVSLWETYFPRRSKGSSLREERDSGSPAQEAEQKISSHILNKIRSSGYASLNQEERKQLNNPDRDE